MAVTPNGRVCIAESVNTSCVGRIGRASGPYPVFGTLLLLNQFMLRLRTSNQQYDRQQYACNDSQCAFGIRYRRDTLLSGTPRIAASFVPASTQVNSGGDSDDARVEKTGKNRKAHKVPDKELKKEEVLRPPKTTNIGVGGKPVSTDRRFEDGSAIQTKQL